MKIERIKEGFFRYKLTASKGMMLIDLTKSKPLEYVSKEILRITAPTLDEFMEVRFDESDGKVVLTDKDVRYLKSRRVL